MINAEPFVEQAKTLGFSWYAGVPCSFLTPFINYVMSDPGLNYISSSNEGDAVATAAGATLAGRRGVAMMQNSGLGNAVNPLTSLNTPFAIPLLLIITLRGDPEGPKDEPQHSQMGAITTGLLDLLDIRWSYFPDEADDLDALIARARETMAETSRPFALVMRKGALAEFVRNQQRPRRPVAVGFAADAAALIVVECARALQRRIASRQPDKLDVEVRRSRLDQRQGI